MGHRWCSSRGYFAAVTLIVLAISPGIELAPAKEEADPASRTEPMSAERVHKRWDLDDLQFSPDGKHLAFTAAGPVNGLALRRNIWILDVGSRSLRQFTQSPSSDHSPRWSPKGDQLAFLSSRSGSQQIHLIPVDGGEARLLSKSETGVKSFAWSPDGRKIAYVAAEAPPQDKESAKAGDLVRIVGAYNYSNEGHPVLWVLDVGTGEKRRLTPEGWRLSHSYWAPNFAWHPRGDRLFISATDDLRVAVLSSRIFSVRLSDGAREELARPVGGFGQLKVSPDGQFLSYLGAREGAFETDDLFILPLSGGAARNLTGSSIDRRIWSYEWTADHHLQVLALSGFTGTVFKCGLDGKSEKVPVSEVGPSGHYAYQKPFAAHSGLLAYVGETTEQAPELWLSTPPGRSEKVSHFNREWDDIPIAPMEILRYSSFDGTKIEAGVLKPAGYKAGTRVPLVIIVHGGPSAKWSDRFQGWGQMLAARGFAVLYPNIRGSTGYGYEFLTMNRKDWGGADFKDVMAGADFLISEGIADPRRLGIGGWSYGGYMSAWAVTQTDRFKAAVAGAPITDLLSEFGTEDRWVNYYDAWYLGTPYDNLQFYIERSPVAHVKKVKTPILLMVGEKDDNTPMGQCLQFHEGLQRFGVEAEVAVFPGSGHFPAKAEQRIEVHRRFVEWFVKRL